MTVFRGYGPGDARATKPFGKPLYTSNPSLYDEPKLPAYHSTELDLMPERAFYDLAKKVKAEMDRRVKPVFDQAYLGLSNFMTGVTHAMACRAALRWLKGLKPYYTDGDSQTPGRRAGVQPTGGEMWTAREGAELHARINTYKPPEGLAQRTVKVEKDCPRACRWNPLVMDAKAVVEVLGREALFSKTPL